MLGSKTRLQIIAIVKNIKASVLWKTQFSHQPVYTSELLTEARCMIAMRKILTQVPAVSCFGCSIDYLQQSIMDVLAFEIAFGSSFELLYHYQRKYIHPLKTPTTIYVFFLLAFHQLFSVVLIVFVQPLISCASITTNLHSCFFASVISSLYKLPLFYQLTKKS